MSAAIVKVPFHGDELEASSDERGVWTSCKRICESIGIDPDSQRKRLHSEARSPWAAGGTVIMTVPSESGPQATFMVHVDIVPMWLATVDASRVSAPARAKLVAYQRECARVLRDHFAPRAQAPTPSPQPVALLPVQAVACLEAVRLLSEPNVVALFGPDLARTKAEHYLAEATGKEPQAVAPRMLTAEDYLRRRGLSAKDAGAQASAFGKLVKGAYLRRHGKDPPKVDRFVQGAVRAVFGYTDADAPLFDEAFALLATPKLAGGSR